MKVDEERKYTLAKYSTTKGKKSRKLSDHNTLFLEIDSSWNTQINNKVQRSEVFNFSDQNAFNQYIDKTENNIELIKCFENESDDINYSTKKWLKSVLGDKIG